MIVQKCIIFSLFILFSHIQSAVDPEIILCTYYTESHKELATQWLLPSIKDTFKRIHGSGRQHCSSATYLQDGWTKTTKNKVEFIVDTIKNNMGSIVIFADADIMFFRPIKEEIKSLLQMSDFIAQIDSPGKLCSGFFALNANAKTLQLWNAINKYMKDNEKISDQDALNHFLNPQKNVFDISWDFLPTTYFGGGTFRKSFWYPGKDLHVPKNPAMFHANWTRFAYKIPMLTYVKQKVENQTSQA